MKLQTKPILIFAALALVLAACGEGRFHTHEAWSRPTLPGGNAAIYFELHNATSQDDELVSITTEVARVVEMHQSSIMNPEEMGEGEHEHEEGEDHAEARPVSELEALDLADVMVMAPLTSISIAAGHDVLLEPGSYHLMMIDLHSELKVGDHFTIVLHFQHSPDLEVDVEVLAP